MGAEHTRDLFRLHFAMVRATGSDETCRALLHTWGRVHDELVAGVPVTLGDLAVGGDDLLELGLPRGPLVGVMLEELMAQVLEAPEANERDELLRRARELIRRHQLSDDCRFEQTRCYRAVAAHIAGLLERDFGSRAFPH